MYELFTEFWSFGMVSLTITVSWLFGVYIMGSSKLWSFSDGVGQYMNGGLEPILYLLVLTSVVLTTLHAGFIADFLIRDSESVIGNITENWNIWRTAVCLYMTATNYVVYKTQKLRKSGNYDSESLIQNIWDK